MGDFDLFVDTYVYETGCSITTSEIITIEVESSPEECLIVLKDNSNILVASDSSLGLNYQWGYDNKQTNQSEIFLNDTLRYIQLSNSIDTKWWEFDVELPGRRVIINDVTAAIGLEQLKKQLEQMTHNHAAVTAELQNLQD